MARYSINLLFRIMIVKTEEEMSVKTAGFIVWSLTQDRSVLVHLKWHIDSCTIVLNFLMLTFRKAINALL